MESAQAAKYNRDTGCDETSRNRRGKHPDRAERGFRYDSVSTDLFQLL